MDNKIHRLVIGANYDVSSSNDGALLAKRKHSEAEESFTINLCYIPDLSAGPLQDNDATDLDRKYHHAYTIQLNPWTIKVSNNYCTDISANIPMTIAYAESSTSNYMTFDSALSTITITLDSSTDAILVT